MAILILRVFFHVFFQLLQVLCGRNRYTEQNVLPNCTQNRFYLATVNRCLHVHIVILLNKIGKYCTLSSFRVQTLSIAARPSPQYPRTRQSGFLLEAGRTQKYDLELNFVIVYRTKPEPNLNMSNRTFQCDVEPEPNHARTIIYFITKHNSK